MIFLVGGNKLVEASSYSGIVMELSRRDYDLTTKSVNDYKKNTFERMGKPRIMAILKTNRGFIRSLVKANAAFPLERLFVYGTLKRGFGNHAFVRNYQKFSEAPTKIPGFELWVRGIPFAVRKGWSISDGIHVESYMVDADMLKIIDYLEGHPHNYRREIVTSEDGRKGWLYVWHRNLPENVELELSGKYQNILTSGVN